MDGIPWFESPARGLVNMDGVEDDMLIMFYSVIAITTAVLTLCNVDKEKKKTQCLG